MLSYLHAFHAGNFADVHKHALLALTLRMLQAKPGAIACFDTHAGSAVYDLNGDRARKTGEADQGIRPLWRQRQELISEDWQPLLATLAQCNPGAGDLRYYPGSPQWFSSLCRPVDSLTAFELHPSESPQLVQWARGRQVRVRHRDGFRGLLQALPPRQPRLLALIDPAYEVKSDYSTVATTLEKAWQRCRHGVYLVWYPLLPQARERALQAALQAGPVRKVLRSECLLTPPPEQGMTGSGMLVVNPPWGLEQRLDAMLADSVVTAATGIRHQYDWLVPE